MRTYVRTYVPNIGFRSLSFEKISLLDSYFIHRSIIRYMSSSNQVHYYCESCGPFSTIVLGKNGFRLLSFERISLLDSYFIHGYIIIKYRPSSNLGIIQLLLWEVWPFFGFI